MLLCKYLMITYKKRLIAQQNMLNLYSSPIQSQGQLRPKQ
uniref:Uncharacterized protein n=1 Tax=Arundo donax TaxID=35708 RepID=A0A0A8YN07_ARUDO